MTLTVVDVLFVLAAIAAGIEAFQRRSLVALAIMFIAIGLAVL